MTESSGGNVFADLRLPEADVHFTYVPCFPSLSVSPQRRSGEASIDRCLAVRSYVSSPRMRRRQPIRAQSSNQATSKRSRFITLFHAATKSRTNVSCPSSHP